MTLLDGQLAQGIISLEGRSNRAREELAAGVSELTAQLERAAAGDLTPVPAMQAEDGEQGTVVVLSASVNAALGSLRTLVEQVRAGGEQIAASAGELLANAEDHAVSATQQSSAVAETTATIEELAATAAQIADTSEAVARYAAETLHHAEEGRTAVSASVRSMDQIADRVESIASRALSLGEKTQEIGRILEVIDDLADQTNLLALNAAIEAARAGEHGKGFAVVAAEVRKLAERAQESTGQIQTIVAQIQTESHSTILATEEGGKEVRSGASLAREVVDALERISGMVDETTTAAKEISIATQQQRSASEQVVSAMTQVSEVSRQYAVGSKARPRPPPSSTRCRRSCARPSSSSRSRRWSGPMSWADDPEVVATFRAEVDERLASLTGVCCASRSTRRRVSSWRRCSVTPTPSRAAPACSGWTTSSRSRTAARTCSAQLRDGRLHVRRDLVDVLLVATEAIGRALPGAERQLPESALTEVAAALDAALAGTDPVTVPRLLAGPRRARRTSSPRGTRPTSPMPAIRSRPPGRTAPASRSGCRRVGSTTCSTSSARPTSTCAGSTGPRRRWASSSPSSSCSSGGCGTCCCRPEPAWTATSPTPRPRSCRSGTGCTVPPASCAGAARTLLGGWPGSATGPWAWRWSRCAGSSPASPRWCGRWRRRRAGS